MKFNKLDVPYQWKEYFTKYPHGYTIFEALCNWTKQVDNMVDNQNNWIDYLDNFVETFEFELQEEVQSTITKWQNEGLLDGIIESALNTELDNVKTQLAETDQEVGLVAQNKAIFKKEVFKKLPMKFADSEIIVNQQGGYIYPQSFTIDWRSEEIFILYSAFNSLPGSEKHWVVVYDLSTESYKSCFSTGLFAGWEGIVVKYEGNNHRFLYVNRSGNILLRYQIDVLPENLSTIAPVDTYDIGANIKVNYNNGTWIIGRSRTLGRVNRQNVWSLLDDDLNQKGIVKMDLPHVGLFSTKYTGYMPKHQGIAIGNNYIYMVIGGLATKSVGTPYNYQGLRVFDMSGNLVQEGILNHVEMIKILENEGFTCERIEAEGVHVSPVGEIYSLYVHQPYSGLDADEEGIIIFKEFSTSEKAIDFTKASIIYPTYNTDDLTNGIYPVTNGEMLNPINGEVLDTMEKICQLMLDLELPKFSFYTGTVNVLDIGGGDLSPNTLVTLTNINNFSLRCQESGDLRNSVNHFNIFVGGSDGTWQKRNINYRNTELLYSGNQPMVEGLIIDLGESAELYEYFIVQYTLSGGTSTVTIPTSISQYTLRAFDLSNNVDSFNTILFEVRIGVVDGNKLEIRDGFRQTLLLGSGETSNNKSVDIGSMMSISRVYGSY